MKKIIITLENTIGLSKFRFTVELYKHIIWTIDYEHGTRLKHRSEAPISFNKYMYIYMHFNTGSIINLNKLGVRDPFTEVFGFNAYVVWKCTIIAVGVI